MGNRLITFEGTSIDVGGSSLLTYAAIYSQVPTTLQSPATAGATIADWQARIATTQSSLHPTDLNILVIGGPANNFLSTGTQAAELASYMSYVAAMKAYGTSSGKILRIVASSLLPSTNATRTAYRPTFLAALKTRIGIDIDAIIDYSIDAILGPDATGANTLYFGDGLHPTVKGAANMARVSAPILDSFINVTTGVRRFKAVRAVPDVTPPAVVSFFPADNATGVTLGVELILTLNEPVVFGTGTISLKKTSDNSTVDSWNVATAVGSGAGQVEIVGDTTLHMHLTSNLAVGVEYYVVWPAGVVVDLAGNNIAAQSSTTTWSFTTTSVVPATWTPTAAAAVSGTFLTTKSFTGVNIGTPGATRILVIGLVNSAGGNATTYTCTVDVSGTPVTATQVSAGLSALGNADVVMYRVAVPTGTTATIAFTSAAGGGIYSIAVAVGALYNVTATPASVATPGQYPTDGGSGGSPWLTKTALTVPANGVCVGLYGGFGGSGGDPLGWQNLTPSATTTVTTFGSSGVIEIGHTYATGSIIPAATNANFAQCCTLAAAWGP